MFGPFKQKKKAGIGAVTAAHENSQAGADLIGFQTESGEQLQDFREQLFDELFGDCDSVSHEISPLSPHIDVFVYKPGYQGRTFYTLVSSGMSDVPMTLAAGIPDDYQRAEILMYVTEPKEEYIHLIRYYARYPHQYGSYFAQGHTIPNGQPAEPYFSPGSLDTVLFISSILSPDNEFSDRLYEKSGIPVQLLHLTPITTAELEFKLEHGSDRLYDIFDENNHPFILDETRSSYV
ncbi:MAG: suppressor of fused domain protein [Pseudomonas sp.]|uniref:suppressor of fused domain protein n=1 Tax=Pseudomonas sp. TaxID=306 RepID=UPI0033930BF9